MENLRREDPQDTNDKYLRAPVPKVLCYQYLDVQTQSVPLSLIYLKKVTNHLNPKIWVKRNYKAHKSAHLQYFLLKTENSAATISQAVKSVAGEYNNKTPTIIIKNFIQKCFYLLFIAMHQRGTHMRGVHSENRSSPPPWYKGIRPVQDQSHFLGGYIN